MIFSLIAFTVLAIVAAATVLVRTLNRRSDISTPSHAGTSLDGCKYGACRINNPFVRAELQRVGKADLAGGQDDS